MGNFEREQVLSGDEPSSELVDRTVVRVVASEKTWIEGNALQQLEMTAQLKGVQRAVGMPDLHAGKGCPIGAAFLS